MYRNLKFLHMTDFFSTDTVLVSVTNMRYALWVFLTNVHADATARWSARTGATRRTAGWSS